jgi:hypothetical protein
MSDNLRSKIIRLAHQQPALRPHLLPLLKEAASKTVKIWEVIYDGAGSGPAGDGTFIYRTKSQKEAEAFAKRNTAWGRPTEATMTEAPVAIARRWGF